MQEVLLTGTVIHSARTAGGDAGLPVPAGSSNRGTGQLATEPSGGHVAGHDSVRHAASLVRPHGRHTGRNMSQALIASILYGRRKVQYGRHA